MPLSQQDEFGGGKISDVGKARMLSQCRSRSKMNSEWEKLEIKSKRILQPCLNAALAAR